jgi:hypothetical protein
MIPALTPGLIFIDILVFCVIIPLVAIFRDEQHYLAPVQLRRKAAVLMALISGVPVMSVYFWIISAFRPMRMGGQLSCLIA